MSRSPRLLTIAGSDSGGGAGIQADLKTFAAHGAYGMSAITALTAQNTLGVRAVFPAPAEMVAAQIDAVFADLGVDGVKIGMLANASIAAVVAERLAAWIPVASGPPLVLDPVMVAASGDPLLTAEAMTTIRDQLLPRATLVTPNLPEAEALGGARAETLAARGDLARELGRLGAPVLLKGGHAAGDPIVDLLWDGRQLHEIRHARLVTRAGHGTGCTLSSAIAARLARGEPLLAACRGAIEWLSEAIAAAEPLGGGSGPVDHLCRQRGAGIFA